MNTNSSSMVPTMQLAAEFGVTRRTLARWIADPAMNFPPATRINHRMYFARADIEEWKKARLMASLTAKPNKAA